MGGTTTTQDIRKVEANFYLETPAHAHVEAILRMEVGQENMGRGRSLQRN